MIQQANQRVSKVGNAKNFNGPTMSGASLVRQVGWMSMLSILLLSPMASFEQDGRSRDNQRQSVAVHRQRLAQAGSSTCCDPSQTGANAVFAARPGLLILPDEWSVERADREMIRNHARSGESILPALAMPLIEDADAEMDLIFQMSNASWMTDRAAADLEIEQRFRIENLYPWVSGTLSNADRELNAHFLSEQGPA